MVFRRSSKPAARTFFVPKMCNHCADSPCTQVCPVGATFITPDGVVLVDKKYCIGCRYCIQACPYGCRFLNPKTQTAEKCTLCYHRITKGLTTACCEACPTGARQLADLKNPNDPIHAFLRTHNVQVLKPSHGHGIETFLQRFGRFGALGRRENAMPVQGYMYPNEVELAWGILIVVYPFITGLVAGAFILASLERVFRVEAVKPTYRLALLTALAFLLVAPLPLQLHLGHPERSFEMYLTPHRTSAMAMFGFVYLWYLMAVLVLEIWLDYRRDIVLLSQRTKGLQRFLYRVLTLGSTNISEHALRIDDRAGYVITVVGIPSAFLLHGYVGFIFGSVKANPWWSSPMMPVVFLFSAMVSGIAMVLLLYMFSSWYRKQTIDMRCVDTVASYLFYTFIIDFSLEMLDLVHRIYEADESFRSLDFMVHTRAVPFPGRHSDLYRHPGANRPACPDSVAQVRRKGPQAHLCRGGKPDAHRDFCHALERGHRRPALFQEFSGVHDLQDWICIQGRVVDRHCSDPLTLCHPVGLGETASAVARP